MNYTLHPGAELDIDEACSRYRKNASGLVVVRHQHRDCGHGEARR